MFGRDSVPGARRAAWGSGWHFLGSHNEFQGDHDVGLPRAHGAAVVVGVHQMAQRVSEAAACDPVADHHPGPGRCTGQKLSGRRLGGTHQFILGGRLGSQERAGR